ncbi:hypothetical protein BSLG_004470 [Batrachochytrium salamandrivorans]|nr:hypothetical protein BASA83_001267 [Batrachochytrium salamandrivorans]KAJ1340997.1 hypothetical protein BSLG_004470 [Batrachochytrium salamandrivorans]
MPDVPCWRPLRKLLQTRPWRNATTIKLIPEAFIEQFSPLRSIHIISSALISQPFHISPSRPSAHQLRHITTFAPTKTLTRTPAQLTSEDALEKALIYCAKAGDDKLALKYLAERGHSSWTTLTLCHFLKHFDPDSNGRRFVRVVTELMRSGKLLESIHCFIIADKVAAWPYGSNLAAVVGDLVVRHSKNMDPIGSLVLLLMCGRTSETVINNSIGTIEHPEMRTILSLYVISKRNIPISQRIILQDFESFKLLIGSINWSNPIFLETRAVSNAVATMMNAIVSLKNPNLVDCHVYWLRRHLPVSILAKIPDLFDLAILRVISASVGEIATESAAEGTTESTSLEMAHVSPNSQTVQKSTISTYERDLSQNQKWLIRANSLVQDIIDGQVVPSQNLMDGVVLYLTETMQYQSGKFGNLDFLLNLFVSFERRGYLPELERYHSILKCMSNPAVSIMHCRNSTSQEAIRMVYRMEKSGILPTALTYSLVFQVAARHRSKRMSLFLPGFERHMFEYGITYDPTLMAHAIRAFCKGNCLDFVAQRFRDMRFAGTTPHIDLYACFFEACSYSHNFSIFALHDLRRSMQRDGVMADIRIYESLIQCCILTRDVSAAVDICTEMNLYKVCMTSMIIDNLEKLGDMFDEAVQRTLRDLVRVSSSTYAPASRAK